MYNVQQQQQQQQISIIVIIIDHEMNVCGHYNNQYTCTVVW